MAWVFGLALVIAVVVNAVVQPIFAATTPNITVTSSPGTEVGLTIFAVANIQGGDNPTGTVTFNLYGPGDTTCANPIATFTTPVAGNGSYTSAPPFQTTQAGTYRWIARYGGDVNNTAVSTACTDPAAAVIVDKARTVLTTVASDQVTPGGPIHDDATLGGGLNPTGTITFNVHGPGDQFCAAAPAGTSTATVTGNGVYRSADFIPTQIGDHRWRATYSGDANNLAVTITPCLDPAEVSTVTSVGAVAATLVTTASAATTVGGQITDTAVLAGATNPTGTITFRLYGPGDTTCANPIATFTSPVAGNGTYTSPAFTVTSPGTYRYIATYSGDANNAPIANACNDPLESVVVTAVTQPTTTTTPVTTTTTAPVATTTTTPATTTTTRPATTTTTTPATTTTTTPATTTSTTPATTTTTPATTTTTVSATTSTTTSPTSTTVAPTTTTTSTTTSTTTTLPSTGTTVPRVPSFTVTPNPVPAGESAVVTGTGFPLGPTDLTLFSTPAFLGRVVVGAAGTFSVAVTIPADTPPGPHRLVVTGVLGTVLAEVSVVVTPPAGGPVTTLPPVATTAPSALGQLVRTGTSIAEPMGVALAAVVLGLLLAVIRPAGPRPRKFPWG